MADKILIARAIEHADSSIKWWNDRRGTHAKIHPDMLVVLRDCARELLDSKSVEAA